MSTRKKAGIVYAIGSREPSSELMLHYAIYHKRPYVRAIFMVIAIKFQKNAEKLGIPITSKEKPYGTIALVEGFWKY